MTHAEQYCSTAAVVWVGCAAYAAAGLHRFGPYAVAEVEFVLAGEKDTSFLAESVVVAIVVVSAA